jgi:hypothetical protein
MQLISACWFEHGNVLILDNAAIHSGGDAGKVKDYLWDTVVDGTPLKRYPDLSSYSISRIESNQAGLPYPSMLHLFV